MPRILHVENEPDTRELVKTILEEDGHAVTSVENGKECIAIYRKGKFDLVLLDIMMPDLSGWDVLGALRKMDPRARIAFLSVLEVSEERKQRLKDEGLADYIMKPFTKKELKARVNALVKRNGTKNSRIGEPKNGPCDPKKQGKKRAKWTIDSSFPLSSRYCGTS